MSKQLPKRAGSRAQYVFWMIVAVTFACMGAVLTMAANPLGLALFFGGIGMAMRESGLRQKWKVQNGQADA